MAQEKNYKQMWEELYLIMEDHKDKKIYGFAIMNTMLIIEADTWHKKKIINKCGKIIKIKKFMGLLS